MCEGGGGKEKGREGKGREGKGGKMEGWGGEVGGRGSKQGCCVVRADVPIMTSNKTPCL